jgi:phage tail sheath protein FI
VPAAGVDYPLVGVLGVEHLFTSSQLDSLNDVGFNIVRPVPQAGICAMGVRTPRPGMPDRYVPVRRTLIYVKRALIEATRFSVFKPNGPDLWATLTAVCQQQLDSILSAGLLKGATASDAYFVVCDDTNNTANTVANGEVHIQVGVAVASPAEFVIIDIGLYQGSTSTTTSV